MPQHREECRPRRSCRCPSQTCRWPRSVIDDPYESCCDNEVDGLSIAVVDRVSNVIYTSDSGHDAGRAMHTIGFVVFPNFYLLGFAAVTAFELANVVLGEPSYQVTVLSEDGGLVLSS